jgi:hypothetical protein
VLVSMERRWVQDDMSGSYLSPDQGLVAAAGLHYPMKQAGLSSLSLPHSPLRNLPNYLQAPALAAQSTDRSGSSGFSRDFPLLDLCRGR